MKKYQTTKVYTSGLKVGLPEGQMGNSEVGHTNIGAGRIVYQELTKITKSIEDGDFFAIPEFIEAIENCKKYNSKLHILGLVSDGGVHSHIRHLYGLLEMAKRRDFENVYVHCFLDGRDTPPASAEGYVAELEEKMREKGVGKVASISGRYYAMDRDKRWERVKKCYDVLVKGEESIEGLAFGEDRIFFCGFLLNEDEARAYAELAACMAKTAKEAKRVSPKATIEENEKYYMRVWLVRIGLGGKDGKDTRKVFLSRLKGHTAFRTEEDKEKWKERNSKKSTEPAE